MTRPSILLDGEFCYTVITIGVGNTVEGVYQVFLPEGEMRWNLAVRYTSGNCVDPEDAKARHGCWW